MYNSKDLVVDEDLTFLSYNQTINAEFTVEEILDSPLWSVNSDNGLIKAIPLFNCDKITSSNESDKVLDDNKCVILENNVDTIVKCISDDTGSMHYYAIELYAYAPYTKLDVIDEVTVYCILHDEYLNTVGNVNVDVYIDDEISGNVTSDSNGVCRFKVDQPCTVRFVYGELESNIVVIDEPQIYTLSIETDKQSLFTDESVTVTGVLTVDGEVYADQSIALYDGSSLIDTVVTDSNGEYTKTVSGLSVGTHVFRAVHAHVRSGTVSVTVNAHSYSLSIVSDKQSILTSESVTISGVLLKDSGAFSGQSVDLYDGVSLVDTLSTDSNGAYEKTLTGLSVGVHTFKAVNSNAESSTISITVNEPTHTYSLSIASDKQSILTTESVTITGTLLMDSTGYSGQSIQLYDGSTLIDTLTTDINGGYSKTISGLTAGTHSFKAVNTNAESSTITVTVTEPTPVHDYSLSVASTKDILSYADSESATLTATLLDNNVAVAGETLSYVIKHGATTIDSGTGTTYSNGEISFNYTATGVGDVDVIVSYSSLLQETYEVQDCNFYDDASSDKTSSYSTRFVSSITHNTDYYQVATTSTQSTSSYMSTTLINNLSNIPSHFEVSVEMMFPNITSSSGTHEIGLGIFNTNGQSNAESMIDLMSNQAQKGLIARTPWNDNRVTGKLSQDIWYTLKLEYDGSVATGTILDGSSVVWTGTLSSSKTINYIGLCT